MTSHKIGDIVPLDHDINPDEVRTINAKRRSNRALLVGTQKPTNMNQRAALKAMNDISIAEHRQRDPFEQCKTFLRSKGYIPVASLSDDEHHVGRRKFKSQEEVFRYAASIGWAQP